MTHEIEPLLHPVSIRDLRPTQMTVGLREVTRKRRQWREHCEEQGDGAEFLGRHMVPAVLGPKSRPYLIDNHHLVRALHDEGVSHVLIQIVADLSHLPKRLFWTFMDNRNWLHPFDAAGKRCARDHIPKSIEKLADDPYRSLAGELRRAGGCGKDNTPYSEFLWADYLRHKIDREEIEQDFQRAMIAALDLAHRPEASYLPGWCGPSD